MSNSGFRRGNSFNEVRIKDDFLLKKNTDAVLGLYKFSEADLNGMVAKQYNINKDDTVAVAALQRSVDSLVIGHAVLFPRLVNVGNAERNAITGADGMMIYNTDNSDIEIYIGGAWLKLLTGAADS